MEELILDEPQRIDSTFYEKYKIEPWWFLLLFIVTFINFLTIIFFNTEARFFFSDLTAFVYFYPFLFPLIVGVVVGLIIAFFPEPPLSYNKRLTRSFIAAFIFGQELLMAILIYGIIAPKFF